MFAIDLSVAARTFLTELLLAEPNSGINFDYAIVDAGAIRDIFRDTHPKQSGVYWFFLPNGTVIDIGMSRGDVWTRVCAHYPRPVEASPGAKMRTGEGWTFPNAPHLSNPGLDPETRRLIETGQSHVGWAVVSPPECAARLEVHLQELCRTFDGALPMFCHQVG